MSAILKHTACTTSAAYHPRYRYTRARPLARDRTHVYILCERRMFQDVWQLLPYAFTSSTASAARFLAMFDVHSYIQIMYSQIYLNTFSSLRKIILRIHINVLGWWFFFYRVKMKFCISQQCLPYSM